MLKDSSMWGNSKSVKVDAIWTFMLLLKTGYDLNLKQIFVLPSFRRNLISISTLNKSCNSCLIENSQFDLFLYSNNVDISSLSDYDIIYLLNTVVSYKEILNINSSGIKRKLTNENSASLLHKRLDHISQK